MTETTQGTGPHPLYSGKGGTGKTYKALTFSHNNGGIPVGRFAETENLPPVFLAPPIGD